MRKPNLNKQQVVCDIRNYIEKQRNYRNAALTAADVADAIGISRTSLSNIMREEMGVTFLQYIDKLRLQQAHHIIANRKTCDLEHIALLVGFATERTFKEKYKKTYGI
jgi:AraC-like DNA-binding protein